MSVSQASIDNGEGGREVTKNSLLCNGNNERCCRREWNEIKNFRKMYIFNQKIPSKFTSNIILQFPCNYCLVITILTSSPRISSKTTILCCPH